MAVLLNILLVLVGFLSLIPVVKLFNTSKDMKYRCLKFLVNATFVWTLLIFTERLVANEYIIYYAHMLGYPLKFLMASFMLCTIFSYIEKPVNKVLYYVLGIVFFIEYLLAMTNAQTQYILKLLPSNVSSYELLYTSDNGPIYIYHLIITYLVLLISIVYLGLFLRKKRDIRHYKRVSQTMTYSVLAVLTVNALNTLLLNVTVDLTYISLVITTFMLYQIIYTKDMIFNIKTSGKGEILSNMREMYILTDSHKRVVELSPLLEEKYKVDTKKYEGKLFSILIENLKNKVVIYEDYNIEEIENDNKDHLHLREKKFTLKRMNEYGYMYLLYDETQVFKLLRELNKISNFDNMTGLHNRNYIESKLSKIEDTLNVGVLSLDLNGLKANNDYLGHERGDYLLKNLADKMKEVTSVIDGCEMARIGGDEFLIIIEKTTNDFCVKLKKSILDKCENEDIVEKISVSIGIAFGTDHTKTIFDLVKEADTNMYDMKQLYSKEYSKEIVLYATNKDDYIR